MLRASKSKSLILEECVERSYKFLEIKNDHESEVVFCPNAKIIKGLSDCPLWPEIKEIERAMTHSKEINSFEMNYGYDPSFVQNVLS